MRVDELLSCCPQEILEDDKPIGPITEALYQGKTVELNSPKRGGTRKFYVYVKNESGNVIKVSFGDPNGTVANDDPKRAASFQARHKCAQEKDRTSANWWSCNVARYAKALGLSSSRPW
jgi:hypothetical protein